ncbi:MAG: hypothetical protein ACE3JP_01340 [Ectobacillus sp.]
MEVAKLERIEIIRAANKVKLYEKLYEQSENQYYTILGEKVKRPWLMPWKKEYEMIVKFVMPEIIPDEQRESAAEKPKQPSEEQQKKEKLIAILNALDKRREPPASKKQTNKNISPEKKQQFLKMLEEGAPTIMQNVSSKASPQQENEQIQALKQAIEELNKKLSEGSERKTDSFVIEKFAYLLKENDVEERLAAFLTDCMKKQFAGREVIAEHEIREYLIGQLAVHFKTSAPIEMDRHRIIALVGPTGVGKTTTLAKIGWQLRKKHRTVGFITTDLFRSGAVSQLQAYADAMGFEMKTADGPSALREAVDYFKSKQVDHILIDTVGRSYMDRGSLGTVLDYLQASRPDLTCLTVSASMKNKDLLEVLAKFKNTPVNGLIITKFDETSSIGELLTISSLATVPIVFVTDGQDVTKHICVPSQQQLAERVLSKDIEFQGDIFK